MDHKLDQVSNDKKTVKAISSALFASVFLYLQTSLQLRTTPHLPIFNANKHINLLEIFELQLEFFIFCSGNEHLAFCWFLI